MAHRLLVCLFSLSAYLLTAQDNTLGISLPADVGYPFNIKLFRPTDSTQLQSAEVLKKGEGPTVVAFWLTTCMPCHRELTAYTQAYESWKKQAKFNLVAISTDFPQRFQEISTIARQIGMPFDVYWDCRKCLFLTKTANWSGITGAIAQGMNRRYWRRFWRCNKDFKLPSRSKLFRSGYEKTLFSCFVPDFLPNCIRDRRLERPEAGEAKRSRYTPGNPKIECPRLGPVRRRAPGR
jgi:thiol-disulfide isomerase/thioredoxin